MACKKQVPAFFKALLYSDGQKAFPKSGELVLTSPGMTGYQADGGNSEPALSLFKSFGEQARRQGTVPGRLSPAFSNLWRIGFLKYMENGFSQLYGEWDFSTLWSMGFLKFMKNGLEVLEMMGMVDEITIEKD